MRVSILSGLMVAGLLAGCRQDAPAPTVTRVNVVTAALGDFSPEIVLTGVIAAQVQSEASFRVGGKIKDRLANVGDHVTANQVLARLDADEQKVEVQAAQASVDSGEATLRQATLAFDRQKSLLATGNTTRREHDRAEASLKSAQAQLEQAHAQLAQATD